MGQTFFCNHVKLRLAMWFSRYCYSEPAASHWQHITITSGQYSMESINYLITADYHFN
jgi:hypothetical protein